MKAMGILFNLLINSNLKLADVLCNKCKHMIRLSPSKHGKTIMDNQALDKINLLSRQRRSKFASRIFYATYSAAYLIIK